jgi:hypothetical protein
MGPFTPTRRMQTSKQKTKPKNYKKSTKLKNGLDLRKYKFLLSKATVIN